MEPTSIKAGTLISVLLVSCIAACGCCYPFTDVIWTHYNPYSPGSEPTTDFTLILNCNENPNTCSLVSGGVSHSCTWSAESANHATVRFNNLPNNPKEYVVELTYDSARPELIWRHDNDVGYLYLDADTYKKYNPPSAGDSVVPWPLTTEITPVPYS